MNDILRADNYFFQDWRGDDLEKEIILRLYESDCLLFSLNDVKINLMLYIIAFNHKFHTFFFVVDIVVSAPDMRGLVAFYFIGIHTLVHLLVNHYDRIAGSISYCVGWNLLVLSFVLVT